MIGVCLRSQSASWISPKLCLTCLIIIQSCYCDYRIKQTFRIFSLRRVRFSFGSLDHDALRAQRIIGFFIVLPTNQQGWLENPITWSEWCCREPYKRIWTQSVFIPVTWNLDSAAHIPQCQRKSAKLLFSVLNEKTVDKQNMGHTDQEFSFNILSCSHSGSL